MTSKANRMLGFIKSNCVGIINKDALKLLYVVINGPCSASKDVKSRVPQRSLLGPILCLIYVNDMPTVTTGSTLAMFADDSKCYKCQSQTDIIQGDLDNLLCWSLANEMNFQPSKCENLRVSRKRMSPVHSYFLDSTSLNPFPSKGFPIDE